MSWREYGVYRYRRFASNCFAAHRQGVSLTRPLQSESLVILVVYSNEGVYPVGGYRAGRFISRS